MGYVSCLSHCIPVISLPLWMRPTSQVCSLSKGPGLRNHLPLIASEASVILRTGSCLHFVQGSHT